MLLPPLLLLCAFVHVLPRRVQAQSAGGPQIQIGPPIVAFVPLYVPDVSPSIGEGLPSLLAERGDVSHILMEFYAPWCPHCQHFAPEMERIGEAFNAADAHSGVLVCRVNCVQDSEICSAMGIRSFPTMYWGSASQFLAAERSRHWDTSGLASVSANPRTADGITAWINARLGAAHVPMALTDAASFDAALAQRMRTVYGNDGATSGAAEERGATASLDLWDVELAMVMSVQLMLAQPSPSTAQLGAMVEFVELLSRNTAPLAGCQGSMHALASYVASVTPGTSALPGLFGAWPSPCGRPLAYYGSEQSDWGTCKGTYPTTRGYTCGLWELFHMLVAHSSDERAATDLMTIRSWIEQFFGCEDCRNNFLAMSTGIATRVRGRDDAVLWLWQAHNAVNLRLAQEQLEETTAYGQENLYKYDPAAPKVAWPSAQNCPRCHRSCGLGSSAVATNDPLIWQPAADEWDVAAVLAFLNAFYDAVPTPAACGSTPTGTDRCSGAQLAAELDDINSVCCPRVGCAGIPTSCTNTCAATFLPWWRSCSSTFAAGGPVDLMAFAEICAPRNADLAGTELRADLWDQVLSSCVQPGQLVNGQLINAFDYSQLTDQGADGHRARPARVAFEAYIGFLAELPAGSLEALPQSSRKALLINAYNALAVKTIVDQFVFTGPTTMTGIRDLGDVFSSVWVHTAGTLAGSSVSLDDVEKGDGTTGLVGLLPSYHDPRIHSSIICASVSCPDLSTSAFTAGNVEELLDARVQAWLAHTTKGLDLDVVTGTIHASKIFDWYRSDFDAWFDPASLSGRSGFRGFLEKYAPKRMMGQLRALPDASFEQHAIVYFDYDWSLNYAPARTIGGGH